MEGSSIDNLFVVSINGLKGVSINTPLSQDQQTTTENKSLGNFSDITQQRREILRSLSLRRRRCSLLRRTICTLRKLGRRASSQGSRHWNQSPLDVSWDTRKTSSMLLSPLITVRSFLRLVTVRSSCGTRLESESIRSLTKVRDTSNGLVVLGLVCNTIAEHSGYLNTGCFALSPDGSLCSSGAKDGAILLWDLAEGKKLYSLEAGSIIHSLSNSIRIWDLESKSVVEDLKGDLKAEAEKSDSSAGTRNETKVIYCKWSADGDTLFSGYTDEVIRVWGVLSLLEKKRRHDDHSNFFYRFKWLLFCTSVLRLIFF
ncbi:unnamed protein product [Brassica oleracea]